MEGFFPRIFLDIICFLFKIVWLHAASGGQTEGAVCTCNCGIVVEGKTQELQTRVREGPLRRCPPLSPLLTMGQHLFSIVPSPWLWNLCEPSFEALLTAMTCKLEWYFMQLGEKKYAVFAIKGPTLNFEIPSHFEQDGVTERVKCVQCKAT